MSVVYNKQTKVIWTAKSKLKNQSQALKFGCVIKVTGCTLLTTCGCDSGLSIGVVLS